MPKRRDPPADPDKYEEAIRAFRKRIPMTDPEFRQLEAGERRRAFWVAGVTQARAVQQVFSAIDRAIADGTTLEDFKTEAGAQLAESWGGEDAPKMETIFRTNVMSAYNGGRHEVLSHPAVKKARPYLRFDAVTDSRISPICEALDGTVLPADDPFWRNHTPPLHFACRSVLVPLDVNEAEDEGISEKAPEVDADEGFGRPPEPSDAEPDLSSFDPDIRRVLRARFEE